MSAVRAPQPTHADLPAARKGDWIQTFSGREYWPLDPRPDEVHIEDVAHHLSMICRYTGAVRKFYSVAEHSVLVSFLVPREHALTALLHDATEAYVTDIARPVKPFLPDYERIEALNWKAVAERFNLPQVMPQCVHEADTAMLWVERHHLLATPPRPWNLPEPTVDLSGVVIKALAPGQAEARFLLRYHELTSNRDLAPAPSLETASPSTGL